MVDATQQRCWANTEPPSVPRTAQAAAGDGRIQGINLLYQPDPITRSFASEEEKQNSSSALSLADCAEE